MIALGVGGVADAANSYSTTSWFSSGDDAAWSGDKGDSGEGGEGGENCDIGKCRNSLGKSMAFATTILMAPKVRVTAERKMARVAQTIAA
jgi:hypothetical protein